jgi:Sec-independent protein translocase protein TatA
MEDRPVNQPSLIPLCDQATKDLASKLVNALRLGTWRKREELARSLGVSVRSIRDAASHARGEIISGNRGLKLTCCATPEEVSEALGRFRSQIREMTRRLAETEVSWHARERRRA